SHCNSQVRLAKALYSDSELDLEIVVCFLDFHEIREEPRNTQKPETDLLVVGQLAQSESANPESFTGDEEE
ncbi:hypothetical protein A2U01_0083465, partial [Trifolium medium]|nr:hypothetical protein [Trifolium medium]